MGAHRTSISRVAFSLPTIALDCVPSSFGAGTGDGRGAGCWGCSGCCCCCCGGGGGGAQWSPAQSVAAGGNTLWPTEAMDKRRAALVRRWYTRAKKTSRHTPRTTARRMTMRAGIEPCPSSHRYFPMYLPAVTGGGEEGRRGREGGRWRPGKKATVNGCLAGRIPMGEEKQK